VSALAGPSCAQPEACQPEGRATEEDGEAEADAETDVEVAVAEVEEAATVDKLTAEASTLM
jgi:hypothetical protein